MENKTVRCPFCDHETKHGLGVCLPCGASIIYGKVPEWAVALCCVFSVVLSALIAMLVEPHGAFIIAFAFFMFTTFFITKAAFKDRVVFRR
ncbi:hypothetical protein NWK44_004726 [Salmonella enterica]|nr:hypothetical protein [Salmonella enterica]